MKTIDWTNVEAMESGEFNGVKPGGYIARIFGVKDEPAKEYLKLELDIDEGEFKGYYEELFKNKNFWGLTLYRSYKESAKGFFKGFLNSVESSNAGYKFNNNEKTLEGKALGIVLAEEEYIGNDGREKTRLYVSTTKSVEDIKAGKFKVPKKKLLEGGEHQNTTPEGFEAAADPDIPF